MVLAALGCGDAEGPEVRPPRLGGVWTVILTEAVPDGRVWIIQADSAVDQQPGGSEGKQRAAVWANLNRPPFTRNMTLEVSRDGDLMRWTLERAGNVQGGGEGRVATGGMYRVPRARGDATLLWQGNPLPVVFDAFQGVPMPPRVRRQSYKAPPVAVTAPGIVTLRMDDCTMADAWAFQILQRLHLVVEVAVPTAFVGRPHFCDWSLVRSMALAGNTIEAHSRIHGHSPTSFGDFYLETVGSLLDLRAQGYDPRIFIQPGTWARGYPHFDAPGKLDTPYGALLRRTFLAVEGYVGHDRSMPLPVRGPDGAGQIPIGAFTPETLEGFLRDVASASQWAHLSWHSARMKPYDLEVRLRVVAALRDSGLVQVLPYAMALFAGRATVPRGALPLPPDTIPHDCLTPIDETPCGR